MEYPSGDPTGDNSTMSTENTSSKPRFHKISDPDVIKVGSQEAQGSLQIYLIFLILHINSSLSSRQRSLQTRQQVIMIIYHIGVHETRPLFSSTRYKIYDKDKCKQVKAIIFKYTCNGLKYILILY